MSEKAEVLDTVGVACPIPIIMTAQRIKEIPIGGLLIVHSDDAGIQQDLKAWCLSNGQQLISIAQRGTIYQASVRRLR